MTDLYVIRHGQTEWNVARRYQGSGDSPLTMAGIAAAEAAAQAMQALFPQVLYASPAGRAQHTARLLFGDMPVRSDPRLAEICLGDMEGCTGEEAALRYPQAQDAFWNHPADFVPPGTGGETVQQLMDRARDFLEHIAAAHPGLRVCAVSHGAWLMAARAVVLGQDANSLWQGSRFDNLKAFRFVFADGKWALEEG